MRRMFDRENLSYKLFNNDIEHLPSDLINELKVGDMLVKEEHNYIVTYKGDTGICMTYHDASCVETVSYDLIDGVWTFNSKDVQSIVPYMSNIVDDNFNKRFVEDEITPNTVSGVSFTYCKWSLSGTHLMIVLAGSIEDTTVLSDSTALCEFEIPQYIHDKIVPLFGTNVAVRSDIIYSVAWATQTLKTRLIKKDNNRLNITTVDNLTLLSNKNFRIQFDYLIDSE